VRAEAPEFEVDSAPHHCALERGQVR
jgi:hypothetical protein